jgi:hypothetical protein
LEFSRSEGEAALDDAVIFADENSGVVPPAEKNPNSVSDLENSKLL